MWSVWVLLWKHSLMRKRRYIRTFFDYFSPLLYFVLIHLTTGPSLLRRQDNVHYTEPFSLEESGQHRVRVLFTPDTDHTNQLMDEVGAKLKLKRLDHLPGNKEYGYFPFSNASALSILEYSKDMNYEDAIIIFENMESEMWPNKLNYTIRMKNNFRTNQYEPEDPLDMGHHEYFGMQYEEFMRLQWAIDTSYLRLLTGANIGQTMELQEFPFAAAQFNTNVVAVSQLSAFLLPFALTLTFVFLTGRLFEEKNSGMHELVKMVGVSWEELSISHVLDLVPHLLLYAVGGALFYKIDNLIPVTCGFYIALAMALHFLIVVALAFVTVYVFNMTQYLELITMSVYTAFLVASMLSQKLKSRALSLLCCLLPHDPFVRFWRAIGSREMFGGSISITNMWTRNAAEQTAVAELYLFMVLQIILLSMIAWYLSRVRPGKYGQALPWNFPFSKDYWCMQPKVEVAPEETQFDPCEADPRYFEKAPAGLPVGIQVNDVYKSFGKDPALSGVSLTVYRGEITVLLGHNGAGKTTLINIITGLISASSGRVLVEGKDTVKQAKDVRKLIGLCPQENIFFPHLTVLEHAMFFAMLKGQTRSQARKSAMDLFSKLQLSTKANALTCALSGGMKRRAQLACAVAGGAQVLVLDEPTSGLDVETRRELWDLLLSLRGERTLLLTTHFMEEADALGDRIAALHHGRLRCHATSMFLKRAIGTGYRLSFTTIGAPKEASITSAITTVVPDATIRDRRPNGVSYNLPAKDTARFPELFASLEDARSKLQIDTIGVGKSTLDEVFLDLKAAITSCITTVPDATIRDRRPNGVSYNLPAKDTARFPELFASLEDARSKLQIDTIGVGKSTLDEVFLDLKAAITSCITTVPDATIRDRRPNGVSYNLPAKDTARFPELFASLEDARSKLQIDTIGVGKSTLDEVFLDLKVAITSCITTVPDATIRDRRPNGVSYNLPAKDTARIPELFASLEDARSKLQIDTIGVGKSTLDEVFLELCGDDKPAYTEEPDNTTTEPVHGTVRGPMLYARQFAVLLLRQWRYITSHMLSFLGIIVFVTLLLWAFTSVANNHPYGMNPTEKPDAGVPMSLELYSAREQRRVLVNVDKDTLDTLRAGFKGVQFEEVPDVVDGTFLFYFSLFVVIQSCRIERPDKPDADVPMSLALYAARATRRVLVNVDKDTLDTLRAGFKGVQFEESSRMERQNADVPMSLELCSAREQRRVLVNVDKDTLDTLRAGFEGVQFEEVPDVVDGTFLFYFSLFVVIQSCRIERPDKPDADMPMSLALYAARATRRVLVNVDKDTLDTLRAGFEGVQFEESCRIERPDKPDADVPMSLALYAARATRCVLVNVDKDTLDTLRAGFKGVQFEESCRIERPDKPDADVPMSLALYAARATRRVLVNVDKDTLDTLRAGFKGVQFEESSRIERPDKPDADVPMSLALYAARATRRVLVNVDKDTLDTLRAGFKGVQFEEVPDVVDAIIRIGKEDITEYNKYLVGIEINDTNVKALYTTTVRHAAPVALNLLSNALSTRLVTGADARAITTRNHPLQGAFVPFQDKIKLPKQNEQKFIWTCNIAMALKLFSNALSTRLVAGADARAITTRNHPLQGVFVPFQDKIKLPKQNEQNNALSTRLVAGADARAITTRNHPLQGAFVPFQDKIKLPKQNEQKFIWTCNIAMALKLFSNALSTRLVAGADARAITTRNHPLQGAFVPFQDKIKLPKQNEQKFIWTCNIAMALNLLSNALSTRLVAGADARAITTRNHPLQGAFVPFQDKIKLPKQNEQKFIWTCNIAMALKLFSNALSTRLVAGADARAITTRNHPLQGAFVPFQDKIKLPKQNEQKFIWTCNIAMALNLLSNALSTRLVAGADARAITTRNHPLQGAFVPFQDKIKLPKQNEQKFIWTCNIAMALNLLSNALSTRLVAGADARAITTRNHPLQGAFVPFQDKIKLPKQNEQKFIWTCNIAMALNLLSNALSTRLVAGADARAITTRNHPLQGAFVPFQDKIKLPKQNEQKFIWTCNIAMVVLFYLCTFSKLPCSERASGARHAHVQAGAPRALHWAATLLAQLLQALLACVLPVCVLAAAVDKDGTFDQPGFIWALCVLLVLGILAFLSLVYLISTLLSYTAASTVLVIIAFLFSQITPNIPESTSFWYKLLSVPYALLAPHTLTAGLAQVASAAQTNAHCNLNRDRCPALAGPDNFETAKCCDSAPGSEPWSYFAMRDAAGWPMLILALQAIAYFVLTLLSDSGFLELVYARIAARGVRPPRRFGDPMARAETAYVEKAIQLPKQQITDSILCHNVQKLYPGCCKRKPFFAVKGVSFSVKKGECFGLLGVNGAGKTTTFKMLTGLTSPTGGEIFANGHYASDRNAYMRTFSYCPQFGGLDDFLTGRQNLALLLTLRGLREQDVATVSNSWIEEVDLSRHADKRLSSYSGGCARRLAAAAALCQAVRTALLDEPTAGVDPLARRRMHQALLRARRHHELIIASHSLDEMEALCHRIAIMSGGELRALGSAAALKAEHAQGYSVVFKLSHAQDLDEMEALCHRIAIMSGGELRALVSAAALKAEHAQGYSVVFKLSHAQDVTDGVSKLDEFKGELNTRFSCELQDQHQSMLSYHVKDSLRYSELFSQLENLREQFPSIVEDYTVTETTLEEVFLALAKEARAETV
ncbi:phospholipid-transporting ATPase ABCA3-like [Cydia amplana]|uniref:phospholipid-transporting ATPase ABCA3-like n=1 Tax=Cydia amplana TaxID=1869771 RepID=UPI002FE513E8